MRVTRPDGPNPSRERAEHWRRPRSDGAIGNELLVSVPSALVATAQHKATVSPLILSLLVKKQAYRSARWRCLDILVDVNSADFPQDVMGEIDFAALLEALDALAGQQMDATLVLAHADATSNPKLLSPKNDNRLEVSGRLSRRLPKPSDGANVFSVGESGRLALDESDFQAAALFTNAQQNDFTIFVEFQHATLFLSGALHPDISLSC